MSQRRPKLRILEWCPHCAHYRAGGVHDPECPIRKAWKKAPEGKQLAEILRLLRRWQWAHEILIK